MADENMAPVGGLNQAAPPSPPPAQTGQEEPKTSLPGETQQATPEEQAQYDHFVAKAMDLTYTKEFMPQVLGMLQGEGDPVEGLARATALIVARVQSAAEQAGEKLPGDVILHAGTEILEDLAELSKEAGIKDYSEDPDALEAAYFRALDQYRVMMQDAGKIDQGSAQRDMAQLQEMDKNGQLESMLSNLAKKPEYTQGEGKGKPKPGGLRQAAGGKPVPDEEEKA